MLPLSPIQREMTEHDWPQDTFKLSWASNRYPQFCFIPTRLRFSGNLFGRLAFTDHSLALEYSNGWHLPTEIQASWSRLEFALLDVIRILRLKVISGVATFPVPSCFGYLRQHKEKHFALKCARNSRAAFVPLLAECSWYMAVAGGNRRPGVIFDLQSASPYWTEVLKGEHVHHVWVDSFHKSMAGEFSDDNKRVGMVIDMHTFEWGRMLSSLMRSGVPLWLYWGKVDGPYPATRNQAGYVISAVASYLPEPNEIALARAEAEWFNPSPQAVVPSRSSQLPSSPHLNEQPLIPFPQVEPYSRQKPRETWTEFFARHAERYLRRVERESTAERTARLNRERSQQNFQEPGRRGPIVFRWEDIDGFRIRMRMNRGEVSTWWGKYVNTQKRYDAFENEWDVCTEFDPDGRPDEDFDELVEDALRQRSLTPEGPPSYPPASPQPPSYQGDLITVYGGDAGVPLADGAGVCKVDLLTWVYSRFGFVSEVSGESYERLEFEGMPDRDLEWLDVCKKLAFHEAQSDVPNGHRNPIRDFVSALITVGHAPGSLWDISASSPHHLGNISDALVRITPLVVAGEVVLYFIDPEHRRTTPFRLAVPHATSALQCLRERWGPDIEDIIRHFLSLGIPFTTRVPGPPLGPTAKSLHQFVGLGYRPQNYKPDLVDYAAYETARLAFCKSERHARAALPKGGIVWRLVQECLHPGDVLTGPTANFDHGHSITSNGQTLWDDDLSEDELDLICGVYLVSTGMFYPVSCFIAI
jgi:hypothetical protein